MTDNAVRIGAMKAYAYGHEARKGLEAYFLFYNYLRPHQALGYEHQPTCPTRGGALGNRSIVKRVLHPILEQSNLQENQDSHLTLPWFCSYNRVHLIHLENTGMPHPELSLSVQYSLHVKIQ
ncbi:MAG: hypothetical protein J4G01_02975 [Dehalococcoidia bacterium]|nr:hypothetical protein [Dehalococcoidia bacterium]